MVQLPVYRQALRARPILSRSPDLFRAVHPTQVLHSFAQVFAVGVTAVAATSSKNIYVPAASSPPESSQPLDIDHVEADAIFHASKQVEEVGAFISHVWSAPRWLKALALYYYINIDIAVVASTVSWIVVVVVMASLNGPSGMGGQHGLFRVFVGLPMLVFVIFFLWGHKVWVPVETLWLDKLCIHQSRDDKKVTGVSALPEVVANSRRMLILLNSDYFDRLWCNAEIATFAALSGSADSIDIIPLWLAPWIIATMSLDIVAICIQSELFAVIPMLAEFFAGTSAMHIPGLVFFLSGSLGVGIACSVSYLPLLVFTWHSLRFKLDIHEQMLIQCSEYTLADAKCTVESDRSIVEGLVKDLFQDSADPINEFESFVRKDLKNHIAARVGHSSFIPYGQSLLLFLPLAFSGAVNVLGCDGLPCEVAAEEELGNGATAAQQMTASSLSWAVSVFIVYPTVYPVMLAGMKSAKATLQGLRYARGFAEVLIIFASYTFNGFLSGLSGGIIATAAFVIRTDVQAGLVWLAAAVVDLVLVIYWNRYLFRFTSDAREYV